MAKMIGKQWTVQPCHAHCCGWSYLGKSPNRKAKRKYLRKLKHRENQAVRKEITDQQD